MMKKGYYYICKNVDSKTNDGCKIGISSNPRNRMKCYNTSNPYLTYHTVFLLYCDRNELLDFEKKILHMFSDRRYLLSEFINCESGEKQLIVDLIKKEISCKYDVLSHDKAMSIIIKEKKNTYKIKHFS